MKIESTDSIYFTFFTAYLALTGTTVITFLASLSDFKKEEMKLKYSLISETSVNIIAGLTYTYIMRLLDNKGLELNKVTGIRYIDWVITTPLLILSFVLYTSHHNNKKRREEGLSEVTPDYGSLAYIIPLNFMMLLFGYLGETGRISKKKGIIYGLAAYAALFYCIYDSFIKNNKDKGMETLYGIFAFVWFLYGVAYLLDTVPKNIMYNVLDIISKAGFGILIWISTFSEDI